MFTGIVAGTGRCLEARDEGAGVRLVLDAGEIAAQAKIGDSIAVNGVCLTVIEADAPRLAFDVGPATLARTNLGHLERGARVNLELALPAQGRFEGHIVQGHVDGVGTIVAREETGEWQVFTIAAPAEMRDWLIPRGAVAVDGVSLTITDLADPSFRVAIIPHTLQCTNLGDRKVGDAVNLEADVIGKYVVQTLSQRGLR